MVERLGFVRNYSDLSTDRGYQFEFSCDRCGTTYRTEFVSSVTGTVAGLLDTAGSLFSGVFGTAANLGERVRSAGWQQGRDAAFKKAVDQVKPDFAQCPRCSSWVCRKSCWNVSKGLCKECAPDLGVEMSAAQAGRSVEEVWAHAKMADQDKILKADTWKQRIKASCPNCEAPLPSTVKFCPSCGTKINVDKHCAECGASLDQGVKFCPDCGAKVQK